MDSAWEECCVRRERKDTERVSGEGTREKNSPGHLEKRFCLLDNRRQKTNESSVQLCKRQELCRKEDATEGRRLQKKTGMEVCFRSDLCIPEALCKGSGIMETMVVGGILKHRARSPAE